VSSPRPGSSSSLRWTCSRLDTAFTIAKWSGLGLIGFYGFWAARLAGAPVPRALAQGAVVAAVGGIVIVFVFKALLHS
jgi:hypothetical protein